ncbi:MAG TPA: DUF1571 domain-containing protein [Gemmatales bacterium]|nr:DUF1571 domain-containing protein [Gemmatales bacterium]
MKNLILKLAYVMVVILAVGLGLAWSSGLFDKGVHEATVGISGASETIASDLSEALSIGNRARELLHAMKGYRCLYLRDELIDNEMQENYLKLTVLHDPFSVAMEWIEPKLKAGRKAVFVTGKNDGKLIVKQLFVKKILDPEESIKMKESRHTIQEAGLKNMVDRLMTSWENESKLQETSVKYSDIKMEFTLSKKPYAYDCRVVEAEHPYSVKEKYTFQKVIVYFDKAGGLPVQMECFDWPSSPSGQARLGERYRYVDVQSEPTPDPKEFEIK